MKVKILSENNYARVVSSRYDGEKIQNKKVTAGPSALAAILIEKWGMVCAVHDGEDSSGRAKMRVATPEEVVDRAMKTAKLFYEVCERENLLLEIPEPVEHGI